MKYKVGDKVRIRSDLKAGEWYGGWIAIEDMAKQRGKVATIADSWFGGYRIDLTDCVWTDEMFEELCGTKIVITSDGITTTAKKYEGKTVVKTAEAKRSPSDTFDFEIGAKLALERLTIAEEA